MGRDSNQRERGNLFTRAWRRWAAADTERPEEADDDPGSVSIDACRDREKVTLDGTLSEVRTTTCAGTTSLRATLTDRSGTVVLIWLGRSEISGIEPGRKVRVLGRISLHQDRRVMYNPRYELTPDA